MGGRGFEVIRGNPGEMTTGGGWDPLTGLVNDVLAGFCSRGKKNPGLIFQFSQTQSWPDFWAVSGPVFLASSS